MKQHFLEISKYLAIAGASASLLILSAAAPENMPAPYSVDDTQDVIYMADGRILHGKLISETSLTIRFELIDLRTGLKSPMTIFKDNVLRIERNVVVSSSSSNSSSNTTSTDNSASEEEEVDMSLPGLYLIPLRGQMGTDIRPEIYEDIIEDVKKHNPECVIFEIDSNALDYRGEYYDFEDYRALVKQIKRELSDYRQVMWIKNSIGVSSIVAFSWDEIYISEDGLLGGFQFVDDVTKGWQDEDIRAKMQAAWSGLVKGFMELGGHDLDIGAAMMFPANKLSATFKGREVEWTLDEEGEVVVDSFDKATTVFSAETARNLRIAQEMVHGSKDDQFNDLAFLLGFREFRKCDGIAEKEIEDYIEKWRATFKQTEDLWRDQATYMGRAEGDQAIAFLGKARQALERMLGAFRKYEAVKKEWASRGVNELRLEVMIEQLRQTIADIRKAQKNRGRGGGRGGGGGPPPGGGGGG